MPLLGLPVQQTILSQWVEYGSGDNHCCAVSLKIISLLLYLDVNYLMTCTA